MLCSGVDSLAGPSIILRPMTMITAIARMPTGRGNSRDIRGSWRP